MLLGARPLNHCTNGRAVWRFRSLLWAVYAPSTSAFWDNKRACMRATGDAYRYTVPLRGNLDVRRLTRRGRHGRTVREKARSRYATCASGTRISTDSNGTDTLPSSERSTRPSSSRRDTSVWTFE